MFKLILSLITIIAMTFLITPVTGASPYGAGKYNAAVPYGGQTELSMSTSGNVSFSITPTDSGAVAASSGTVTVTSTDVVGYKLYIRSLSSTDMVNGATVIPASANGAPSALAVNTWGYNLDAGVNYDGMTLSDTLIRSATQAYSSGDVTTVTYGVKVNNAKKSGGYTTSVIYTAVPQTN